MFGTGRALWDRSESLAARRPITEDRSLLQVRANAALHTLSTLEGVDPDRLAAVGYCFGGMAVLDLARMGPAATPGLKAVASLHGILVPILPGCQGDADMEDAKIGPRVVVLHATGDPFVPPEQVGACFGSHVRVLLYLGYLVHGTIDSTGLHTAPKRLSRENALLAKIVRCILLVLGMALMSCVLNY